MIKVQKVYYCEYGHCIDEDGEEYYKCDITTDESVAKELDEHYRLASIGEFEEWLSLGGDVIPVVELQEGVFGWVEMIKYITSLGDEEIFQGYVWIHPNMEDEIRSLAGMIERTIS